MSGGAGTSGTSRSGASVSGETSPGAAASLTSDGAPTSSTRQTPPAQAPVQGSLVSQVPDDAVQRRTATTPVAVVPQANSPGSSQACPATGPVSMPGSGLPELHATPRAKTKVSTTNLGVCMT